MNLSDTICGVATPSGAGGIGIVRISGDDAEKIISKLFNTDAEKFEDRKLYLKTINGNGFSDKCLAVIFRAPNSYTGENVAEIHCHGGRMLVHAVLEEVLSSGARMAVNGEFTKRAFLNGKMSLDESEGVADMINAESKAELNASYSELAGKLKTTIQPIQEKLTDIISEIEVAIDYPEEEIDYTDIRSELDKIVSNLKTLEDTFEIGQKIKGGVNVGVVGVPNVGKSSLLNAILNFDRAIVTDIPGTTRDTISESVEIEGVKFNLTDTAGIRKSNDEVEKKGVEKSMRLIKASDLLLFVTDGSSRDFIGEEEIAREAVGQQIIYVYNKADKDDFLLKKHDSDSQNMSVVVSAKTGEGIDTLKKLMINSVKMNNISERGLIITSERHYNAIVRARQLAEKAASNLDDMLDISALLIKEIWDALGEITGTTATEDIIDNIFSKFCLGK